ncbi:MAG: citrate synthase [Kiritimatiellae bacterium]|jgi:citrate synthase|nr:citrate synthase [Kiritimatiellia bacterium]
MEQSARLVIDGKEYTFPIVTGTNGERAINISTLREKTGLITLDTGYVNTGNCQSRITYINGEKGILEHRGYRIEDLAEHSTFVENAYLLIHGELPTKQELTVFSDRLNESSLIHEDMRHYFVAFPHHAHPMGILTTMVASLATFYPVPDVLNPDVEEQFMANLISQVRTLAAFSYKKSIGEPVVYPSIKLRYVQNFLNMMFSSPVKDYKQDPEIVQAVELFLILHADHEQNCSSSTVRLVGSSLANIYSVISAGMAALWGPRHGGANQEVILMLEHILANGAKPSEFIERAKNKTRQERLMGFGHRVYKNFDPRALILKKACHKLLKKPGMNSPLFDIALQLEELALKDDYFIERHLYPNVDFYSGLILKAVGIPYNMFTVLFAIGRVPGWIAQWREMVHNEQFKIVRPRQIYTGEKTREYIPIEQRKALH